MPIVFVQGLFLAGLGLLIYKVSKNSMSDFDIRKQNYLSHQSSFTNDSPTAMEKRKQRYAKEMKEKQFTMRVIDMKPNKTYESQRAKKARKEGAESIK